MFLGERAEGYSGGAAISDQLLLVGRQLRLPSESLPFGSCTSQTGLGPLNKKITLELRNACDDTHRHLTGRAGQVHAAKRKAVDAHTLGLQLVDRALHVHGVATQPIKLGHDQGDQPSRPGDFGGAETAS
jgi:hypothetical protein